MNVGLRKISETVEQVEELRKELSSKNRELEQKKNEAKAKLDQVVEDSQEIENKERTSGELK